MSFKPVGNGLFVLSYADRGDAAWDKIKEAKPNFVVTQSATLDVCIAPGDLQSAGIKVLSYVATGFEKIVENARLIQSIKTETTTALSAGFDGVFFDETMGRASDYGVSIQGMKDAYEAIKDVHDLNFTVFNSGVSTVDSFVFDYADIVCVENKYFETPRALDASGNEVAIEDWRWLSVQGDPATSASSSLAESIGRLELFRKHGGFWYYSTPRQDSGATHYLLTPQFEDFANYVKAGPNVT